MAINVSNKNGEKKETNIIYQQARIKTGDKKGLITFLGDNAHAPVKVDLDELTSKLPKLQKNSTVESCQMIYDTENQEVIAINPWSGVFDAIGVVLGPRSEDGEIQPFEKSGTDLKTGQPYTTFKFWEQFKITDKEEEGGLFYNTTPRWYLQDKFYKRQDGMTDISGTEKSKWTVKLRTFGEVQNIYDEDIEWDEDDNFGSVLPALEERILENKTPVRILMENGYIDTIKPARGYTKPLEVDDEPVDEDDEPDFMKEPVEVVAPAKAKSNGKVKKISKAKVVDLLHMGDDDLVDEL